MNQEHNSDDNDDQHLVSKRIQKRNQQDQYFYIPDAKPILSKKFLDAHRPKVFIREVVMTKQQPYIINAQNSSHLLTDKLHYSKQPKDLSNDETIWSKYMVTHLYRCLYLKYYPYDLTQLQEKNWKKTTVELLKLCRNREELFPTYVIDLSFLGQVSSSLLKNLLQINENELHWQNIDVQFDSRFENGNLLGAFEHMTQKNRGIRQYDLVLQNDINTKGYSNWFYFKVMSKKAGKFKFNIVNIQKSGPLYATGMKVAVFSKQRHQRQNLQWHRDGYNYCFKSNQLIKPHKTSLNNSVHHYNCLSFYYDQKFNQDIIHIASNTPYSYSRMLKYIEAVEKTAKINSNIYFKKQTIAQSISQNSCPIITLTWKRDKKTEEGRKRKKIIGIIARQHPCETVSSFVCEGMINALVYLSNEFAVYLLKNFIFKIVPMVNIDGVIYGNSRCDITGTDINRKWSKNPNKVFYPIVSSIKKLFSSLIAEGYEIQYFLDLHGHSLRSGFFMYSCKNYDQIQTRELAWIMSKLNSKFNFDSCTFGLSELKRQTARGCMHLMVTNKKSMTIETSFFGSTSINGGKHFDQKDLHEIGGSLIQGLYADLTKDPKLLNWKNCRSEIHQLMKKKESQKKISDDCEQDSGSDSYPQEDQIDEKDKAELFLSPSIAARIGLSQSKVVRKVKKQESHRRLFLPQYNFQSLNEIQVLQNTNTLSEERSFVVKSSRKISDQKKYLRKQFKSVTKILPFKLSEEKKNQAIRSNVRKSTSIKPIDMPNIKVTQKLQIPENCKEFMKNFKKEYELLLKERTKFGKK